MAGLSLSLSRMRARKRRGGVAPALFFSDTFTGSAGTLVGTVSESGGTWSKHPVSSGTSSRSGTGIYQPDGNIGVMRNSQSPPSADYFIECDILVKSVIAGASVSVAGRMSPTALTFYAIRYDGNSYNIFKSINDTRTTLATWAVVQTTGVLATMRLEIDGDQLTGYVDSVLRLGPITDDSITAAGSVGSRIFGGTSSPTTGPHIEAMRAGSLTVAISPVAGGLSISSAPEMGSSFSTLPSAGSIEVS